MRVPRVGAPRRRAGLRGLSLPLRLTSPISKAQGRCKAMSRRVDQQNDSLILCEYFANSRRYRSNSSNERLGP
ncbi:hypothetical protein EVAR_89398_1 [Eumeta japonica]|uniref:Uncharacterized protein n=1 Tax=Eumeta variegata TaxID=151549 RepID=A0A4C1XUU0_EUMVA|nr:hypothetical protein EVAR_89398_1 [Eumeta japonica]